MQVDLRDNSLYDQLFRFSFRRAIGGASLSAANRQTNGWLCSAAGLGRSEYGHKAVWQKLDGLGMPGEVRKKTELLTTN